MKQMTMKIRFLIALTLGLMLANVNAANLVVQQNGPAGTYSSISAAIAAATDGDRIIINNRIDGLPWLEDISVNKTLTFVSAVDLVRFWVQGIWTIVPQNGRKVEIIGMRNTATGDNITVSTSSGTLTNRTKIHIFDAELSGGVNTSPNVTSNVNQVSGTDLYLGSSIVNGKIRFSYGKIIGNKVTSMTNSVEMYSDLVSNNDTIWIVGNDILTTNSYGVYTVNNSNIIMFFNNYVQGSTNGLRVGNLKDGSNLHHLFVNNSIASSGSSSTTRGLYIDTFTNSNFSFINNVFMQISNSWGYAVWLNNSSHAVNFYYNIYESEGTSPIAGVPTNIAGGNSLVFNADRSNNFSIGTNAGNPSNFYLDLDLSRNDIGVYGGSYSFANFHPLSDGKSSRVNFVTTPRIVHQGTTFRVDALGFDK